MAPRIEGTAPHATPHTPRAYHPGPSLTEVQASARTLARGHSGAGVRELQALLNAAGIEPRLAEDGLLGPKTEAALRQLQASAGLPTTGVADATTLEALRAHAAASPTTNQPTHPSDGVDEARREGPAPRAPAYGAPRPSGAIPAGQLARDDEARARRAAASAPSPQAASPRAPGSSPTTTPSAAQTTPRTGPTPGPLQVQPGAPAARADGELAQLQARTMDAARRDLAAGVREEPAMGDNRGRRVDQYARDAGMSPGGEWCGYFSSFQYSEAARSTGGTFEGRHHMHSMQKARAFFEYRSYTDNRPATNQRLDDLRARHEAEGSTRRWMTLSGSGGERHATAHGRPHEVFEPSNLPIRAGDTAIYSHGHVGLVESYDQATGRLVTIEGNTSGGRVARHEYDLNDPRVRARFEGFGRPARGDFTTPSS